MTSARGRGGEASKIAELNDSSHPTCIMKCLPLISHRWQRVPTEWANSRRLAALR